MDVPLGRGEAYIYDAYNTRIRLVRKTVEKWQYPWAYHDINRIARGQTAAVPIAFMIRHVVHAARIYVRPVKHPFNPAFNYIFPIRTRAMISIQM